MIRLHLRSRLVLNTLFLTVNLFDRAILTGQLPRECYSDGNPHLLLTCLLIAGKFEEVEVRLKKKHLNKINIYYFSGLVLVHLLLIVNH